MIAFRIINILLISGDPVDVELSIHVLSLGSIAETTMVRNLASFLYHTWFMINFYTMAKQFWSLKDSLKMDDSPHLNHCPQPLN